MIVREIFYSLQGEGHFTGTPAVFLRFSGCNLTCPFCDTDHGGGTSMSLQEILDAVSVFPARHIVITGGEPSLQLGREIVDSLHSIGFFIQVETNGTGRLPEGIDWVTCSPKSDVVMLDRADELKIVYTGGETPAFIEAMEKRISARCHSLQPCDCGNPEQNAVLTAETVEYVKSHPRWRLSLQTHKMLEIP